MKSQYQLVTDYLQDIMGDRQRCEFDCTQALLAGKEVVIDRFACHTLVTA